MIKLSLLQKAILSAIIILLPILITFLITYRFNKEQIEQRIKEDLAIIADGYEAQIYQFLEMSKQRVRDFSSDGFIRDQLKKINQRQNSAVEPLNEHLLKNKMPLDRAIQAIYVISVNNRVAASTDSFSVGKYTSIEHFLKNGKLEQTIIENDAGFSGLPEIEISSPIPDRETGNFIGIIVNVVSLSELNKIMSGYYAVELGASLPTGIRKGMEAYLVNQDKLMITESANVKNAILNQIVDTMPVRTCLESGAETASSYYKDYNGAGVIGASECFPSLKWTLLVEINEARALLPLAQMRRGAVITGAIVAWFIGILLVMYIRKIVMPVKSMSKAANEIAGGNYRVTIPVGSHDELGELSRSFNAMAGELEAKTYELKKLYIALDRSINIVFITDIRGKIEYVNPMFEEITGWSKEEAIGQTPRILSSGETNRAQYEELWQTILAGKTFRYVFKNKKKNGQHYWANTQISPIQDEKGEIIQFLAMQEDVTEKKKAEDRAEYLSHYDELTGLINRSWFMKLMDKWIEERDIPQKYSALFLIDIDEFKSINELYGHNIGDEFLRRAAIIIKDASEEIRAGNEATTASEPIHRAPAELESMVGYLGGDDFAVFLTNIDETQALSAAELIRKKIESLYFAPLMSRFTASIGIALYPHHGTTTRGLFSRADIAMYRAKGMGRNKSHVFQLEDRDIEKIHSRLMEKERIQNCIKDGCFEPWFQPILDLKDDKIHHYEALARMQGQDNSILLPGAFIDTAEIFGLVGAIDRIIIEKTIRLHSKICGKEQKISFSINLSGKDLGDEGLLAFLQSVMAKYGTDPSHLIFEITETAAIHDMDKAKKFIHALKSMGCHFCLDDFGVGFTSFVYLREMGVDYIKIDGSFIRKLNENLNDRLFVKAIVDVAKGMGIKTVAEFVENEEILKLLKELDVDYAQGFYVGKPAPWPEQ